MTFPKIPVGILIICVIFAFIGGLWGFYVAGLINLNPLLQHLPVIGTSFVEDEQEPLEVVISPLEVENEQLKDEITTLQNQLLEFQTKEIKYQEEIEDLKKEIEKLKEEITSLQHQEENIQKLAQYYGQMKPERSSTYF